MRACISLCVWRQIEALTIVALYQTLGHKDVEFTWSMSVNDALIDRSRGIEATRFLDNPDVGDVLLFVDSDILFRPDDAAKLVKECNEEYGLIGGGYVTRSLDKPHLALALFPNQTVHFSPESKPVEVMDISTGFMAIRRDVLQAVANTVPRVRSGPNSFYPVFLPFYTEDGRYLSEDWAFTQRARACGFKVWLDPSLYLVHMGYKGFTVVDAADGAMNYAEVPVGATTPASSLAELDPTGILEDLAAYWKKPVDEVWQMIRNKDGRAIMAKQWREYNPKTPAQVERFYRKAESYIIDLAQFNLFHNYFSRAAPLLMPERDIRGLRIVDFGGGIGTLSLALKARGADVIYVDVPSEHRSFALFRFLRHKAHIPTVSSLAWVTGSTAADIIVACDVMEHIHPDALPDVAQQMYTALRPGGEVRTVSDFGEAADIPAHYNSHQAFVAAMQAAGFEGGPDNWRKPDG